MAAEVSTCGDNAARKSPFVGAVREIPDHQVHEPATAAPHKRRYEAAATIR